MTCPVETGEPGALLARGVELLGQLAGEPVVRWYRADTPAIVTGRGQRPPAHTDLPVVQRHSGGGAVLMDEGLLCCDVLVPAGHPLLGERLTDVFEPVGRAWAAALTDLGVEDLTVHTGRATTGVPICFASLGRGEVLAGGRKVVGLAQRRRKPGALVQCGLLRRWAPGPLLDAFDAHDVADRAVGIDELVDPPPSDEQVIAAVESRLWRVYGRPR